jgi:hypothetical protein
MGRAWAAIVLAAVLFLTATPVIGRSAITSLRALTAAPTQFANRAVTVAGRFRGRSASAGTTVAPINRSRWDFLLDADGAAVWVTGIRPAGWDFDLDPRSASDARRGVWLEVTGTVRLDRRAARHCARDATCRDFWIEASDLRPARGPAQTDAQLPLRPPVQAPIVVFHDPVSDEADVAPATSVRLQFSRPMIPETFSEHIRIAYASPRVPSAVPIPRFSAIYSETTRSLAITFAAPLASHQSVRVELLEGIVAVNGRPFEPWAFEFSTGQ